MTERRRILVVDDEPQITRMLRTSLSAQGYDVRDASDGHEALQVMSDWTPDLVISDLVMPNMGGLELCKRIRSKSQLPIIILSVRGHEHTKVEALDAGADDYVTKPFGMDELLARLRANLRRTTEAAADQNSPVIDIGDFHIDVDDHTVAVCGRPVRLTPKEFELLVYLARHPRKVITHRALLAAVWGDTYMEQPEYLRVFVNHLRKKLEPDGGKPRYILTEPWVGYRFEAGDQ